MKESAILAECKLCDAILSDKTDLVEHLRTEHDALEIASFVATVMLQGEERDKAAKGFHRKFDNLKNELVQH